MRSSSALHSRRSNNTGRVNAERRLGLPRPSLDSMRTTRDAQQPHRPEPTTDNETDYDSYYDDEDDGMEEEALLSRRHGEAPEDGNSASNSKKKRGATDQDIAKEYAEQEKEKKKKARRNVHNTVTPDDLIKPKGLTVVRNGIAPKFHSFNGIRTFSSNNGSSNNKSRYTNTTASMAKYSRRLVSSYADWMDDMKIGRAHV